MHLLDLFESTNEGYTVTRGIDKDRYQERRGLEGPFQTKSGKVVYYDKKEGRYYDPDTDMYIDHEDYRALDESELAEMFEASYGAPLFDDDGEISSNKRTERILGLLRAKNPTAQNDLEALIMSFDKGQKMDREDINTLYSQNREEEREIDQLEKELERIKKKRAVSEDYYETDEQRELARLGRILKDMGKKRDDDVGQAMGFLGTQLTRYGTPQGVNSIEKLEKVTGQPESVIMKMMALAQKVKGDVAVGDETTSDDGEEEVELDEAREDTPMKVARLVLGMGVRQSAPDDEILKRIPFALKKLGLQDDKLIKRDPDFQGEVIDVFRGLKEGYKKDYLTREKERIGRASDEFDVGTDNWEVKIDGKPWKVFRNKSSANQAASTIEMRYGKKTSVFATRKPVSEGIAEDFDTNFSKRVGATVRGGKGAEYLKKKAKERQAQNKELDPRADKIGLGIGVLDAEKARKKAAEKGVEFPRTGVRTSPRTHDPKRLPEEIELDENASLVKDYQDMKAQGKKDSNILDVLMSMPKYKRMSKDQMAKIIGDAKRKGIFKEALDHDIKIGDTVETKKMGQMQGVVTGFSTKTGDTRVMFKHKSGKVYATVPDNLRVIDKVDEASRPTKMRFPGERFSKELNTQDFELSSMYDHRSLDQLYQSLNVVNNAIQKDTLRIEKLQDAGKKPVKSQQALDVNIRRRDYISNLIDQKKESASKVDTAKKTESQVAENIDLRHNLQPGTYKHNEENITVTINSDSSVSFKQPAEWEIEGDGEYLEFAEAQLADASNWTAVVEEAKKKPVPTNPQLWGRAKAAAKQKYDVWPSAYSSAYAAKWYKEKGGGWRMGKPKK